MIFFFFKAKQKETLKSHCCRDSGSSTDSLQALGSNLEASFLDSDVHFHSGWGFWCPVPASRPITGIDDSDKCIQLITGRLGQNPQPVSRVKTPAREERVPFSLAESQLPSSGELCQH